MATVVFASWRGFPGCVASCRHAAAALGGVAVELEEAEAPPAALEADLLVLSAWTPGYERLLDQRFGPTVGRSHSSLLQTELSREGWKVAKLLELLSESRLTGVAFDDADAAAALARPGVVHLPNVFDPCELAGVKPTELDGVNVALPGQPDARKNVLVQTAAFARAQGRLEAAPLRTDAAPSRLCPLARACRRLVRRPRLLAARRVSGTCGRNGCRALRVGGREFRLCGGRARGAGCADGRLAGGQVGRRRPAHRPEPRRCRKRRGGTGAGGLGARPRRGTTSVAP